VEHLCAVESIGTFPTREDVPDRHLIAQAQFLALPIISATTIQSAENITSLLGLME
jgi:hypothetical protein